MGIDWSKVCESHVYLVQNNKSGEFYTCDDWLMYVKKHELTILAKRPKPPLTNEQIEAVREYVKWLKAEDLVLYPTASIDEWLKERGGE